MDSNFSNKYNIYPVNSRMQIEVRSHFNKRFWNFGVLKLTRLQFKIKFYLLSIWKKYFLSNFQKNCSFFQHKKFLRPKNMAHYSPSSSACYYLFSYQICRQVDWGWPCHCQLIWDYILILRFDFWHQKNVRRPIHPWILRLFSKIYNWRRDIGCFVSSLKSFISFFCLKLEEFLWSLF